MGNAFAQKQESSWFQPPSSKSFTGEDATPVGGPAVTDTSRFDPKDPVHAQVHGHLVDDIPHAVKMDRPLAASMGTGISGMSEHPLADLAGPAFGAGDWILAHGGQVALDLAGFVPGVNIVTEGAQSGYHSAHAAYDLAEGNEAGAREESAEAGWHGAATLLNAFTAEGGNEVKAAGRAAHAAHSAAHAKHVIHDLHTIVDVGESAWDLTSTLLRGLGGDKETLPFLGAAAPWIANGGGGGKEHS